MTLRLNFTALFVEGHDALYPPTLVVSARFSYVIAHDVPQRFLLALVAHDDGRAVGRELERLGA